jgi:hypothetical protein
MSPDAQRLLFIVAYAGSDAGRKALDEYLAEVARLRRIEELARDVVNVALNDAGPQAFETMAEMRALLSNSEGER